MRNFLTPANFYISEIALIRSNDQPEQTTTTMKITEVEIFTDQGNGAVLRLPKRKFPGLVIQGDTLRNLAQIAERVHQLSTTGNEELQGEAELLAQLLKDLYQWYESVLNRRSPEEAP
jgi:hypothetical protein